MVTSLQACDWADVLVYVVYTPPKTNMGPENDGF